jgi:hypothetical protein
LSTQRKQNRVAAGADDADRDKTKKKNFLLKRPPMLMKWQKILKLFAKKDQQ